MNDRNLTDEGGAALERHEQIITEMKELEGAATENKPKMDALQAELAELRASKVYRDALLAKPVK